MPRLSGAWPARLFLAGVLALAGGYAALNHEPADEAGARPLASMGSALFWLGVVLMLVGAAAWLQQPPVKRKRRRPRKERSRAKRLARDDDDVELIPCRYCGKPIYEESERCPECGNYISAED